MQRLVLAVALALPLAGCWKPAVEQTHTDNRAGAGERPGVYVATREANGVSTATLDPASPSTQLVAAPKDSGIPTATVSFPPGSLAISTDVSLQEGSAIATPSLAKSLDVTTGFGEAAPAVLVSSSVTTTVIQPFTLAIPAPAGASLVDGATLVVVYRVETPDGLREGLIPRERLTVADGIARFTATQFGVYQATLITTSVAVAAREVPSVAAIQPKAAEKSLPRLEITGRAPFLARGGQLVTLTGRAFRPTMRLAAAGKRVAQLDIKSDVSASFALPDGLPAGLLALTVDQDGVTQTVSLAYAPTTDHPVIGLAPAEVCQGTVYYDMSGALQTGTRSCTAPVVATCAAEGQTDCLVSGTTLTLVTKASLDAQSIKTGVTIGGVAGAVIPATSTAACAADGAASCVVDGTTYRAAKLSNFTANDVRSGVSVAGVAGTLADCAADGATGCIATTGYRAANMTNVVAGNVRTGVTIAAVAGDFPSATYTLAGASGTTDLTSLAPATAAGSYEWWDGAGARHTGTISDASTITPSTATQTFNTSVYRQFTVNGDANLVAGKIKNGTAIFGVTGAYPSAPYPLTGADGTADLDFATFDAKIKSSASFEWFDPNGTRYTYNGTTQLTAANIANGVTVFGSTGTFAPDCASDGAIGCRTVTNYPSVDKVSLSAWDIRKGKAAGGLTGALAFCKNGVTTTTWNYATAPATGGLDVYDTIDDYANNLALPAQNPFTGGDLCNSGNWQDLTTDGTCNISGDQCVFKDLMTGLKWSEVLSTSQTWTAALSNCNGLGSFSGVTGWRLPTEKELQHAYGSGIRAIESASFGDVDVNFWSSTTQSNTTTYAYQVDLGSGATAGLTKTGTAATICVAP